MSALIVFLDPLAPQRADQLRALLPDGFRIEVAKSREEADQIAAIAPADFAVSGDVPITGAMLRAGTRLKGIHKWGVGVDNFDLPTARALGITVMRTTGSNALAVAETAVALMLAIHRSILPGHLGVQEGKWLKGALGPSTFRLSGKTVGLVGLGHIGANVARLLKGFNCRLLYVKPRPVEAALAQELGVTHVDLPTLLAESDVVSLHCPLSPETRGMLGARQFAAMKDGAILINTARGGIYEEAVLAEALRAGKPRAAAIDVYEIEPVPRTSPLLPLPNVITTPHIASQAADGFKGTVTRMFGNIERLAKGEPVPELDLVH